MKLRISLAVIFYILLLTACSDVQDVHQVVRSEVSFNEGWRFLLAGDVEAQDPLFDDSAWRLLNLPHDWSIEGMFSEAHPASVGGGALPGGTGWYRKAFKLPEGWEGRRIFIDFDGVYQNSEVWINGQSLGKRPNGYISFRYELTPFLHPTGEENTISVKVDNSLQPNSRWYSGSGIYRDVSLVMTGDVRVDHWGTFVTTPEVTSDRAAVMLTSQIVNSLEETVSAKITYTIRSQSGKKAATFSRKVELLAGQITEVEQLLEVKNPMLWSPTDPALYTMVTEISSTEGQLDKETTTFGIRSFDFDAEKGFSLNGTPMKIQGVCMHHDLGALGAAAFPRAMERQLELLKEMGCNAIRTSHNPPAPELLRLCDRMGFMVMDETFDMWKMKKTEYDYHLHWDGWHERDLKDHIMRDRNHPSVIMWSIGNEILEQWDASGEAIATKLAGMVRALDPSRPITSGCNEPAPHNSLIKSGALDIIGFNYQNDYIDSVPGYYKGIPFIASETTSALATRGSYDIPSDSIRIWPLRWDRHFSAGNADQTCSSYDNCHVPWGSTHERALMDMKNNDFISGMFVWTGFDYLGEPTPYGWPSRSSYFGILDLAGFPKDAYYLYKSEWTDEAVLHLFPHWNWSIGDTVDVWTYTSCKQVELFLNGTSLGTREKTDASMHMQWRVPFEPGTLIAKGSLKGQALSAEVITAGKPAGLRLVADRQVLHSDPMDLSFVTAEIVDSNGVLVPDAGNEVHFRVEGEGIIEAVDNGLQTSMEPFKASKRSAFNGLCLAVIRCSGQAGKILLTAESEGLHSTSIEIEVKQ